MSKKVNSKLYSADLILTSFQTIACRDGETVPRIDPLGSPECVVAHSVKYDLNHVMIVHDPDKLF